MKTQALCVILFSLSCALRAQPAGDLIKPIDALATRDSTAFLDQNLAPMLAGKNIFGLGEVCHGGHEPFALKAQFVRYLITQHGYRQMLIESADITLRELDNYLNDPLRPLQQKTLDSLFERRISMLGGRSTFDAAEVRSLFSWIKSYNLAHPGGEVSVRGVDISGMTYNYFKQNYFSKPYRKQVRQRWGTGSVTVAQALQIVTDWHTNFRDSLAAIGPSAQRDLAMDWRAFQGLVRYQSGGGEKSSALMNLRDSLMALNVADLLKGKAILWAHNAHISGSSLNLGLFRARTLGNFLRERYGRGYGILLTDFSGTADITVQRKDQGFEVKKFRSDKRSMAYQLARQHDRKSGWVSAPDVQGPSPNTGYNSIGAKGAQNFLPCSAVDLDILVYVEHIGPSKL